MPFNKVILLGNLTRDAELRYIPSGSAVLEFAVAVSRKFKKSDGGQGEEVAFVECELWGKRAEALSQHLRKGKPLLVEGRLKQDQWEDKETGQKRSKLKVTAENVEFVGGRQESGGGDAYEAPPRAQSAPAERQWKAAPFDVDDDSNPFTS